MRDRVAALLRRHGPSALLLLVVVGVALWPLPAALLGGADAIGHAVGDLADHYWGTWWFGRELLSGAWPGRTDLVQFPGEVRLWYVDPLGGLLGLLLRPLGFPNTWNALVLLQVWLGALAAYAVGTWASGSRSAGLVAGAYAASSPYLLGLAHSGLSEYLGIFFPVLFTGALVSTMGLDPLGRRRAAPWIAGLLLAGCAAQAFYYAAFGALLTGLAVLGPGWRDRLRVAVRVALVFAVASAPLFVAAWATLTSPDAAVTTENAPGWAYKALPATDLLTFFRPGEHYFPDTREDNPGILHVNYLGWAALALAGLGLARRQEQPGPRALLPLAGAYALFALGPRLCVDGRLIEWGEGPFPLPLAALYLPGSPFRFVHHPYRMVVFLIPIISMMLAWGARRLPPPARGAALLLVLAEALTLSPAPWPLATTSIETPAAVTRLPQGPVLDWPPDATLWNRRYSLWQVSHGQPIAYGVNTFLTEDLLRDPLIQRLLRVLLNPDARARNRDVPYTGRVIVAPRAEPSRLAEMGFRTFVLHGPALAEGERKRSEAIVMEIFGLPILEDDIAKVWSVR